MLLVVLPIFDPMICEAWLPDVAALVVTVGESSFDELHGTLQGNLFGRREQRVEVVGHDDELVEKEFPLIAIVRQGVDQEPCGRVAAEDRKTLDSDGGDEENAFGSHSAIMAKAGEDCR